MGQGFVVNVLVFGILYKIAGNATKLAVQGVAVGASFVPGVGWGVALGIGLADAIWGDDFYNWIGKK